MAILTLKCGAEYPSERIEELAEFVGPRLQLLCSQYPELLDGLLRACKDLLCSERPRVPEEGRHLLVQMGLLRASNRISRRVAELTVSAVHGESPHFFITSPFARKTSVTDCSIEPLSLEAS